MHTLFPADAAHVVITIPQDLVSQLRCIYTCVHARKTFNACIDKATRLWLDRHLGPEIARTPVGGQFVTICFNHRVVSRYVEHIKNSTDVRIWFWMPHYSTATISPGSRGMLWVDRKYCA